MSRWRSGWSDYGIPTKKTIRESKLWGSGAATVTFSTDFNVGQTSRADLIFGLAGTWPTGGTWGAWIAGNAGLWPSGGAITDRLARKSVRGTTFSTQFSSSPSSPDWSIHRVSRHMRETREASIR
jgi:hypothetical protein